MYSVQEVGTHFSTILKFFIKSAIKSNIIIDFIKKYSILISMFDPSLTKQMAEAQINDANAVVSPAYQVQPELITLLRESNVLREQCFRTMQSHAELFPRLKQAHDVLGRQFLSSAPTHFFAAHGGLFIQSLPLEVRKNVAFHLASSFQETVGNAAEVSDDVRVQFKITEKGLLIDVDQCNVAIPSSYIDAVRDNAHLLLTGFLQQRPPDEVMHENRQRTVRPIGYVPSNTQTMDISPYRGNGTNNLLLNTFFRLNYVPGETENHTLILSTPQQVQDAIRLGKGDLSLASRVYGPGEVPISTADVDDIFGGGFNFKDLLP
jgi:hypothetical protein